MSEIQLFGFQTKASDLIATRFSELVGDSKRPYEHQGYPTPYYQALAALTGAGKTPILADAVVQMRARLTSEPVVLWISKAKAVVEQTLKNFQSGGKYSHLVEGFNCIRLSETKADVVRDGKAPLLILTTVGTFNQKNKEDGTLRVHKSAEDSAGTSLWSLLGNRQTPGGGKRPLIIVYDEGHNLSDQQADLLLELEPEALLVASATMRTPGRMGRLIDRLRDYGWQDESLVTPVQSKDVVDAGLVKKQIVLGGYATLMEAALNDMLELYDQVKVKAKALDAGFIPKAIYVCKTNISQEDGTKDNHLRPFKERKAPPILIWRYLVEQKSVDPSDIAVYCDLKFDRKHNPPPDDFVHFSGGEDDFTAFSAGNYHHIIFNQSLQEGWDDPECCFAYIDKSMGTPVPVEQVIGRVLRQPNARHYADPDLNTAQFFIRIDTKSVFPEILETVRKKIAAEAPEVRLDGYSDPRERARSRLEPKQEVELPEIHIDSTEAIQVQPDGRVTGPFAEALDEIIDYRADASGNTIGKGETIKAVQVIGDSSRGEIITKETPHSNRVMARWIVRRGIQALYPRTAQTIDWSNPKFDAKIEITSPAATTLRDSARKLVDAYLQHSDLTFEEVNPYKVGPVLTNPSKLELFKNALHDGYSDLKPFELEFAREIDETGLMWCRNPSNGGYAIPLLQIGSTFNFYPDFLVWRDGVVFALDPKGDHLIAEAAGAKLLNIKDEKSKRRVVVRLFTDGKWSDPKTKVSGSSGITLWDLKAGQVRPRHFLSIQKAVEAALKI